MQFRRLTALLSTLLTSFAGALFAQGIELVTEETSYSYWQDGKVAGPASAVAEATMQRAGLTNYRMGIYPWARAYEMARQEANILIYLIARTPSREALFKWVGEVKREDYYLYKLRRNADIVVPDLDAAKNYSIGVLRNDVRHEYLKAQGFDRLVVSAQNIDNFRKLLNGHVQLVPMPENDANLYCAQTQVDCGTLERVFTLKVLSTGLYMAYSATTPDEVVARTRAAFAEIKADGTLEKLLQSR